MVFHRAKLKVISLRKIVGFSALSLLAVGLIFSVVFLSRESESFKRLTVLDYQEGGLRKTIRVRYDQWLMAACMLKDYPLTGVGIGAYIIELPNYWQLRKGGVREWTDSAENYFLQVGSELGVLSLFFSFWIFWEILKQIKKSWEHYPYLLKGKYLQIGILSGIITFMLNFLVHTYIGSYEVIYTFWLLVALMFSLNSPRTSHTALATQNCH